MSGYRYYTDELGVMHFLCGTDEMTPPVKLSSPVQLSRGGSAIVAISECKDNGRVTLLSEADLVTMNYQPDKVITTPEWLNDFSIRQQYTPSWR
ncbi:hypothetical protein ACCC84_21575 [Serratia odorifera]|jgi:hypothetical protein|uniref:hypothetical protein n=1 Tax=Serratia TaxID=613 RepID=UPI001F4C45CF|nr:hypothetical protein [Serratia proteamaculans]ULG15843.1 hypothetical protein 495p2_00091 [Serratia proteamaculans]